jgi:hypothetical protein
VTSGSGGLIPSIIEYIEEPWGLALRLHPVQRFILKLFYHLELDSRNKNIVVPDVFNTKVKYRFTETEYLRYKWNEGEVNIPEQDHERRVLILPIGRRAGKTLMSACVASYETFRILHIQDPYKHYGLAEGNPFQIVSVATDKEQAGILFKSARSHFQQAPFFRDYIANHTQTFVAFQTARDINEYGKWEETGGQASISVTFKSCVAKGLRGPGNIVIILDEFAHFVNSGRSASKEVWDAITPSTATFSPKDPLDSTRPIGPTDGRILAISSPYIREGKFFELYDLGFSGGEGADNILVIKAHTSEVNPTMDPVYLKGKYAEDPEAFMIEFGAEFANRVRGWIEREEDVTDCVIPGLKPAIHSRTSAPGRSGGSFVGRTHECGVDLGVTKGGDGTVLTLTALTDKDEIEVVYHEAVYAGKPLPDNVLRLFPQRNDWSINADKLDFDDIADWIYHLSKQFSIREGLVDQWNGIPLIQSLHKKGLRQFRYEKILTTQHSLHAQNTKVLLYDRRIRIPEFPVADGARHSELITELLTLEAEQTSRNIIRVHAPNTRGGHDDRFDSLVRAVWLTTQRMMDRKHAADPLRASNVLGAAQRARPDTNQMQMRNFRRSGITPQRGKMMAIRSKIRGTHR